jgi:pantothenate kinase type III
MLIEDVEYSFAALDIGNTSSKLLFKSKIHVVKNSEKTSKLTKFLPRDSKDEHVIIGYSSVNEDRLDRFRDSLRNSVNLHAVDAMNLLEKQDKLIYKHIEGIGSDRVIGLYSALQEFEPPLITVDCGTAVTVNAVDKDGTCLGGAIFAGIETQMNALENYTSLLQNVNLKLPIEKAAGRNTTDAIRSGLILSVAGGVREIVNRIFAEEFSGQRAPVILTGGGSQLIFDQLISQGFEIHFKERLILDGIMYLLKNEGLELEY